MLKFEINLNYNKFLQIMNLEKVEKKGYFNSREFLKIAFSEIINKKFIYIMRKFKESRLKKKEFGFGPVPTDLTSLLLCLQRNL